MRAVLEQLDRIVFAETTVHVGGRLLRAQVAETTEQRLLGMSGRRFDGFDALLFAHDTEVRYAFHGRGLLEALVAAVYDRDGRLVDQEVLDPGRALWRPARAFKWALEVPRAAAGELHLDPLVVG